MNLGSPYGIVRRSSIYELYTEALDDAVSLWKDYRRFSLPHGSGYANETEEYMTLIRAFEDEYEEAQADAIRRARDQSK